MAFFRLKLHWQILFSLIASLVVSIALKNFFPADSAVTDYTLRICDFAGTLFLNALKMIVVPLIASSLISGVVSIGDQKGFARMGAKTLAYYIGSTLIAVIIGLITVNIFRPGHVSTEAASKMLGQAASVDYIEATAAQHSAGDFIQIFIEMIPENIVQAASHNGDLLAIIFFGVLFGFFITRLPAKQRALQERFWEGLQQITLNIADLILVFAPIGIFALVTPKFVSFGFELFVPIGKFTITVMTALLLQFFVVMPLFLLIFGRVNPIHHYRAMAPALLTAFSTSSSVSTLPITMECVEKTAGVSNRVSSFTLPLGATINMNGTALYECIVVVFVAQFYQTLNPGFEFGFTTQIVTVLLALGTSIGVAGIPAASLVAIAVILNVVGLPVEYVGIVLVVDRILDMCRTAMNIFSDSVGAVIVGKSEGETHIYQNPQLPQ